MAGWAAILIIIGATLTTCYTAKCLVWCFNTLNAREVRGSGSKAPASPEPPVETYDQPVEACFGRIGALGMKGMTVIELFGGVICSEPRGRYTPVSRPLHDRHRTLRLRDLQRVALPLHACLAAVT